jgi:hypothetical protein
MDDQEAIRGATKFCVEIAPISGQSPALCQVGGNGPLECYSRPALVFPQVAAHSAGLLVPPTAAAGQLQPGLIRSLLRSSEAAGEAVKQSMTINFT